MYFFVLTLSAPISQNGQTHANTHGKLPTNYLSVFDHFVRLALKGLSKIFAEY